MTVSTTTAITAIGPWAGRGVHRNPSLVNHLHQVLLPNDKSLRHHRSRETHQRKKLKKTSHLISQLYIARRSTHEALRGVAHFCHFGGTDFRQSLTQAADGKDLVRLRVPVLDEQLLRDDRSVVMGVAISSCVHIQIPTFRRQKQHWQGFPSASTLDECSRSLITASRKSSQFHKHCTNEFMKQVFVDRGLSRGRA